MPGRFIIAACLVFLLLAQTVCQAQTPPEEPETILVPISPPVSVEAEDVPNDIGNAIRVSWEPSPDEDALALMYNVYVTTTEGEPGDPVTSVGEGLSSTVVSELEKGQTYFVFVSATDAQTESVLVSGGSVVPTVQWFNRSRWNVLISVGLFTFFLIWYVLGARRGREYFIRRMAGLEAVDEAIGRATEMGKPILYVPGISTMDDVATIASMSILSRVAKKAAQYETRIIVPNRDPIVTPVAQEVVKEACMAAGRPDRFFEDDIFYVTYSQFGYAAAVDGIMVREKPATNFLLGMFYAESLILAETGASTGAIQIAGTDAVTQLPFFIAACDYTLIGEELYAASAYLSREPKLLGSLKAQDLAKLLIVISIFGGAILTSLGWAVQQYFAAG